MEHFRFLTGLRKGAAGHQQQALLRALASPYSSGRIWLDKGEETSRMELWRRTADFKATGSLNRTPTTRDISQRDTTRMAPNSQGTITNFRSSHRVAAGLCFVYAVGIVVLAAIVQQEMEFESGTADSIENLRRALDKDGDGDIDDDDWALLAKEGAGAIDVIVDNIRSRAGFRWLPLLLLVFTATSLVVGVVLAVFGAAVLHSRGTMSTSPLENDWTVTAFQLPAATPVAADSLASPCQPSLCLPRHVSHRCVYPAMSAIVASCQVDRESLLGHGAFGAVYKATKNVEIGQSGERLGSQKTEYALKCIAISDVASANEGVLETMRLVKVKHRNVVKVRYTCNIHAAHTCNAHPTVHATITTLMQPHAIRTPRMHHT